eukprot:7891259-Lingulodinium_polyedra.AAC.1
MDPVLARGGAAYGEFLSSLLDCGVAEVGPSVEQVGIFFVLKKSGALRLIFDTRRSNMHCAEPAPIGLPSGENLANVSLDPGTELFLAGGDVECCFY